MEKEITYFALIFKSFQQIEVSFSIGYDLYSLISLVFKSIHTY